MTLNKYGSNIQEFYWKGRPIIEGYRYGRQFWPVAKENKVSGGTPIKTYIFNPVTGSMIEDTTPLGADFKLTDPYNDSYKEPVMYGGFIHLYMHEGGDPSDDTAYITVGRSQPYYNNPTYHLKRGQWIRIWSGAPYDTTQDYFSIFNRGYHGAFDLKVTASDNRYQASSLIPGIKGVTVREYEPESKVQSTWKKDDWTLGTFEVADDVPFDTNSIHSVVTDINGIRRPGLGEYSGITSYTVDIRLGYITSYRTDLLDKDVYLEATKYTEENEEGEVIYNRIYMQWVETLNDNCIMRGSFDQNLDLYNLTYIV